MTAANGAAHHEAIARHDTTTYVVATDNCRLFIGSRDIARKLRASHSRLPVLRKPEGQIT